MLLWVAMAALAAVASLSVLLPLYRARRAERPATAQEISVYRDQLGEVESDHERGLIGEADAEAARIEIARRLLATDAEERGSVRQQARAPAKAVAVGLAVILPLLALGVYLVYGSPRLPDQPLVARALTTPSMAEPELSPYGVTVGGEDEAWLYREAMLPEWKATPAVQEFLVTLLPPEPGQVKPAGRNRRP